MADKKHKKEKGKFQYFNAQAFAEKVLEDCDLGEMTPELRQELLDMIERRLGERITASIVNSLQPKDMDMFEELKNKYPEMDDIDVLTVVASQIPGLQIKILKGIEDLYDELTYDAKRVNIAVDRREQAKNAKL